MTYTKTQQNILNTAETLIQLKGFNAFSFKDIANSIGIKTSSVHYHFKTKEDLCISVIDWHVIKLTEVLEKVIEDDTLSTNDKLHKCINYIFNTTYESEFKMCLGGILASEVLALSDAVRSKIQWFFTALINFLDRVIKNGSEKLTNRFSQQLLIHIEGALLLGRLYKDRNYLHLAHVFIDEHVK